MCRKSTLFVFASLLMLLLALSPTTLNALQSNGCPTQGSGAAGVAEFVAANQGVCLNPATTCNGQFTIQLLEVYPDGNLITFEYEVCQIAGQNGLSHLSLGIPTVNCDGIQINLSALVVGATLNGEAIPYVIGLDPTTQVNGLKFNTGIPGGSCGTYAVTFDKSALPSGYTLGAGCVLAATKAGSQDIQRADRATPGYAMVLGPVCELEGEEVCETAFALGDDCFLNNGFSRWGWSISLPGYGSVQVPVYAAAGQCDLEKGRFVGWVEFEYSATGVTAIFEPEPGVTVEVEHLYAGTTSFPVVRQDREGNNIYTVAPGQYYVEPGLTGQPITVIYHAVVCYIE